jgi:polar amino acid transport system substrate-binding protein
MFDLREWRGFDLPCCKREEPMTKRWKIGAATLIALVSVTAAAAAPPPKTDAKIAAEVPTKIRANGTLLVATAATYAPNEFTRPNGHAVLGMDPDLIRALATVMGLRTKIINVRFDTILSGVASGRYDLGMSSITVTRPRAKRVDFATYFSAGTSFYVKANAGPDIKSLADLCGRTAAVVAGTTQATDAEAQTAACRKAGKPDVKVAIFPDHLSAYIALESSSQAVGMADSPVAAYIVKNSRGQLKLTGTYGRAPYGIALPKANGMAKPVLDALKKLIADGTYRAILTKWGIQNGAIANPRIAPAAG